jgi:hypothetical protein
MENYKQLKKEIKENQLKKEIKKVERPPTPMDFQNQHSKYGYITKINLHVQCNYHQNSNDIYHRD